MTVLSHPRFRILLSGSFFTYLGQWIQQASLSWVAYEITGSGALLGAMFAVRAIPMIGLAPFAGVAADRYDRRKLLLASQLASAVTSFVFGMALSLDLVTTPVLFAFTLVMGTNAVLDRPTRHTLVFESVPRDIAMKAVGLHSMAFSLNRMAGPAVAGYLIAWLGGVGNFFIQGVLYLAAFAMAWVLVLPPRSGPSTRDKSTAHDLLSGFRHLRSDRTMRMLLVFGLVPYFLLVPVWSTLLPIYAKDVFDAGPKGFGALLASVGIGATLGGALSVWLARYDHQGRIQIIAMGIYAATAVGLAASPSVPIAAMLGVVAGAAEMAFTTSTMTMLQMSAPEALRGRISSLMQLFPGFISLGALLSGTLADLIGVRQASALLALICAIIVAALFAGSTRLRGLRLSQFR
jgi:MFS family permease